MALTNYHPYPHPLPSSPSSHSGHTIGAKLRAVVLNDLRFQVPEASQAKEWQSTAHHQGRENLCEVYLPRSLQDGGVWNNALPERRVDPREPPAVRAGHR